MTSSRLIRKAEEKLNNKENEGQKVNISLKPGEVSKRDSKTTTIQVN